MERKLFCQLSPITYRISVELHIIKRWLKNRVYHRSFAKHKSKKALPYVVYGHKSLILRKLGNVDMVLQYNKENNLKLTTPKINNIVIKPGEVFSFWELVGRCTSRKGYLEGLVIRGGVPETGIAGGMCQFTNLIHWMVLHSPLDIIEHHHHNKVDLFPDYNRQIPFGTGTSVMYNYLDYQFKNNTDITFQLLVDTDDRYLIGELRANKKLSFSYHVVEEKHYFEKRKGFIYRNNTISRKTINKKTGNIVKSEKLIVNHAKVLYDESFIKEPIFVESIE